MPLKKGDKIIKKLKHSALKPDFDQNDLFFCDLTDAGLKDDMASMEHPVFTISKKPEMVTRIYEHNGHTLEVHPSTSGIATMYDKDILIYATSKIMQAKNRGEPVSAKIVFEAQEALRFMRRTDRNGRAGGTQFRALETSLKRLKGTMLVTNIKTNGKRQVDIFGLIDSAIIYREDVQGRVLEWGIELSDWMFQAILGNEVLTLHPDYFRLRKPIEKRVYELARRHCGSQDIWKISLEVLLKKTGSHTRPKEFKKTIKNIVTHDHLPDYHIAFDKNPSDKKDLVVFTPKRLSGQSKFSSPRGKRGLQKRKHYTVDRLQNLLDDSAIGYTQFMAREKGLDWYVLVSDFTALLNTGKGDRDNLSASFVGYVSAKK